MKCNEGYRPDSPLCAVCAEGYSRQIRDCFACQETRYEYLALCATGFVIFLVLISLCAKRYWAMLTKSTTMAHMKIIISFVTVIISVDVQFGIAWPWSFARALDALAVLTFDPGIWSSVFCIVEFGACVHTLLRFRLTSLRYLLTHARPFSLRLLRPLDQFNAVLSIRAGGCRNRVVPGVHSMHS